ncbi:pirin family protein [bacterium]|nr:pirin family protein [bacterium]
MVQSVEKVTRVARSVEQVVQAQKTSDGAGVKLSRSIGSFALPDLDPFLLLDEFKSDQANDYIAGFPDHPHRGFETVTYMLAGAFEHKDSTGERGILTEGCVQWMTAGRGIIHSEMPIQKSGLVQGFQLWINLPGKDKMKPPRYQNLTAAEIPEYRVENGVVVKAIAGELEGLNGTVHQLHTEPVYLDVLIPPHTNWSQTLPEGHRVSVYVFEGIGYFGDAASNTAISLDSGKLGVLSDGDYINVQTQDQFVRFLLLAARPLNEPVVRHGPFVMNTVEEIDQAVRDYHNGKIGS